MSSDSELSSTPFKVRDEDISALVYPTYPTRTHQEHGLASEWDVKSILNCIPYSKECISNRTKIHQRMPLIFATEASHETFSMSPCIVSVSLCFRLSPGTLSASRKKHIFGDPKQETAKLTKLKLVGIPVIDILTYHYFTSYRFSRDKTLQKRRN